MSRKSVGKWVVAGLAVGLLGLGGCQDRSAQEQEKEGTGGAGMEGQPAEPYVPPAGGVEQEQLEQEQQEVEQQEPSTMEADPSMQPSTGGAGEAGSIEQPSSAPQEPITEPPMGGAGEQSQETIGGSGQVEPEEAERRDGGSSLTY